VATTRETTVVERLGRVLYWVGCGLAAAIIMLGVAMLIGDPRMGVPFAVAVVMVAVLAWLAGKAAKNQCRGMAQPSRSVAILMQLDRCG